MSFSPHLFHLKHLVNIPGPAPLLFLCEADDSNPYERQYRTLCPDRNIEGSHVLSW